MTDKSVILETYEKGYLDAQKLVKLYREYEKILAKGEESNWQAIIGSIPQKTKTDHNMENKLSPCHDPFLYV